MKSPEGLLDYTFTTPPVMEFGWGKRARVGEMARNLGRRAFLVSGSRTLEEQGTIREIEDDLLMVGVELVPLVTQPHEPLVSDVDRAVSELRNYESRKGDFLLAVGGGSAIDLAKAVAALATNRQGDSVQDFLEGVGKGLIIEHAPLPLLAMPTTAGTGTEATRNAVISNNDPPFKKSLRSPMMVPDAVLIDPELTVSLPPELTAYTGMDAITQLLESYISKRAKPIPQALCLQGLEMALPAIETAVKDGSQQWAREQMAHAALLSGLALANSGLGMAHGVAAALGVHCHVPHGLACAVMLPTALRVNSTVARKKLETLSRRLLGEGSHVAIVDHVQHLCEKIGIPQRLSELGVTQEQIPAIVPSSRGNSMSGNPVDLSDEELTRLLEGML